MKLLIVDDEPDLRELISFAVETKFKIPTVTAKSGNEAMQVLKSDPLITGVISDYHMQDGTGGDLFKFVSSQPHKLPFLLCTAFQPQDLPEFKDLQSLSFIGKPFRWEDLVGVIAKAFMIGPKKDAPAEAEQEYFPVRLKALTRINIMHCDVFVKLNDHKYVKLMRQGDAFSEADRITYESKKIDALYLNRKDCDSFLSNFTQEVATLSTAKTLPWNSSCEAMEGAYESIYDTIKTFGFTPEAQDLAKASAKLAIKTIVHLPRLSEVFLKSGVNTFLYSHSALLAQISCLIASACGWTSETTQYKLALASFLHDMAIKDPDLAMFELTYRENERKEKATGVKPVTDESYENKMLLFRKHPDEGAHLLTGLKGIPEEVSDIILHHHERPDGSGIPLGLKASTLSPLTSLFIAAQDVVFFIWEKKGRASFAEFLAQHKTEYTGEHFNKINAALATL